MNGLRRLGWLSLFGGTCAAAGGIYLATGLTLERAQLDAGEFLETVTLDFADAYARMKAGTITDVKTIIGLYQLRDRGWN